jgi:hypothetical protein
LWIACSFIFFSYYYTTEILEKYELLLYGGLYKITDSFLKNVFFYYYQYIFVAHDV